MDLDARLAAAVTDDEARSAIFDAVVDATPTAMILPEHIQAASWSLRNRVNRLLEGPSAGWLGVGVLMIGAEFNWEVTKRGGDQRTGAELWRPVKVASDTRPWHFYAYAKRPDCALVLAALRAARDTPAPQDEAPQSQAKPPQHDPALKPGGK